MKIGKGIAAGISAPKRRVLAGRAMRFEPGQTAGMTASWAEPNLGQEEGFVAMEIPTSKNSSILFLDLLKAEIASLTKIATNQG